MIRELPANYLSLKLGINVHNAASMNIRTFRPAVIGFVHIVREKHPDTPLVVISPIFSPPRETTPNAAESTLTPNPPKRWAVALTPGMMGKGRRTGQARFQ